jgi:hypothetical protein
MLLHTPSATIIDACFVPDAVEFSIPDWQLYGALGVAPEDIIDADKGTR